ncbi:complement C3-like [Myxocyprinus asiaticus]|uniref:complement C3-like n=1 Tax=Myxocyprinus asiaticus TaxID=70543 RepID=UPI0022223746|nr:complement C3-like [Myxocyprinus asiaticus]
MHVDVFWVITALLSFPPIAQCKPLYVMIAPQILKVDTVTNVFVEVQDYPESSRMHVTIRVLNFPTKDSQLHNTTVELTGQNNYQSIAQVKIPYRETVFNADSDKKQYVYLQANFPDRTLEKVVLVSFQSGYIFVQTDKTIYTPDSIVKYRIFVMDTNIKPVDNQVIIETVTPDGIIVKTQTSAPDNGMMTGDFGLASPVINGIWQISAKFKNDPHLNYTAEFEVKEYVLPRYQVKLKPDRPFFYIDDQKLLVNIEAEYLFGQPVEGSALAVFGIIVDNKQINFPESLQRVPIKRGKGFVELKREHIHTVLKNSEDLVERTIFISVSVMSESGNEIVEAQRGRIHIVKSPYTIHFTRTPKYFKPGMPFYLTVYLTNPDQTPAEGVELFVDKIKENMSGKTSSNGMVKLTVNTDKQSSSLKIIVKTRDPWIRMDRQAENEIEVHSYTPKQNSKNYLHIDVTASELKVGDLFTVKLNLGDSTGIQMNQDFTYLVISKGRIVSFHRFKGSGNVLIALPMTVTKDMVPSFRIVAYYHVDSSEVVSDSVWVDVKDTCMGTLEVQQEDKLSENLPSSLINLKITGDPGAKVGLVAVDKAIYVLNNRSRLTQAKIWDYIERQDIACTAGSGIDAMGVFYDAGLLFESDNAGGTVNRREFSCPSASKRRRRDVSMLQLRNTLVGQFHGTLKQCCLDGMVKNLLEYSCERRSEYIEDGDECKKAFLYCCHNVTSMKEEAIETELILAKSSEEDIEDIFNDFSTRTSFPESWMWDTIMLPNCDSNTSCKTTSVTEKRYLKDSITTWVITAISLSKDKGICVANPKEIVVQKKFFIDLKLPYSAVVKEQIEIKAVLHNFLPSSEQNEQERVFVELLNTGTTICSEASNKKHRKTFKMAAMSSHTVTFPIIPLAVGEFDIEVRAAHFSWEKVDKVKKKLKVVTNGVLTKAGETTLVLDPARHGGSQNLLISKPILKDQMPGTDAKTYIIARGQPLVQLTEQAISGEHLGRFIEKPYGCAEQNMMRMALPVIATHYLDKTNQWNEIGVDRRAEALNHISTGFSTQQSFRNSDHSYGMFHRLRGNMWLTAYVVKIFSMAHKLISINPNVICDTIKWLISNTQQWNGSFQQMGVNALHHTAFVLMALQEGTTVCSDSVTNLESSKKKAIEYIENHISSAADPYVVAMASYTLANAGKLKKDIFEKFFQHSSDGSHWPVPSNTIFTLEATGYALLTLVKIKNFTAARPVMRWLTEQQGYMGHYESSQATVVVFQALAKYLETVEQPKDSALQVVLTSTARRNPITLTFTKGSKDLQRSDRFNTKENLTVKASGSGEGSISVVTFYYTRPMKKTSDCKNFELNVTFKKELKCSYEDAQESYKLTIEIRFLSTDHNAGMTIVDVSMMTGFKPDLEDLEKLVKGKDRYIHKYEEDKDLTERGSLIIYLNKVSNTIKERIVFKVHKMMEVDSPHPAGVSVYEYYSDEKRCVKFYDAEREEGLLGTVCQSNVCICADENCAELKVDVPSMDQRKKTACTNTDYIYVAALDQVKRSGKSDLYTFNITHVIKEGTEDSVEGQKRDFSAHSRCSSKMNLKQGKSYLIMGPTPTRTIQQSYWYTLTAQTWLEYWPTDEEGKGRDKNMRERYSGMLDLKNKFEEKGGCQT